ncbi:MAG: hypothetical protein A2992_08720 [Elusimicrobia bacterium RIFCSPLOWO2_01_FULL_59_12]|nr:MAG: hypothetical protein A2992_08720 [Elusimicrobia bacterium RIFCSPLOWO2_01_FULL_59_12]
MVFESNSIGRIRFFFARAGVRAYGVLLIAIVFSSGFSFASDLKTKYAELETLKTRRTSEVADELAATALRENDTNFRLAVLDQLAVLGYTRVIPAISSLLKDESVAMRQRTARVIGMLGGVEAENALVQALVMETDTDVKAALLQGLSLCGSARSIQAIRAELENSRPEVRANAEGALRRIEAQNKQLKK